MLPMMRGARHPPLFPRTVHVLLNRPPLMAEADRLLGMYLHLARASSRRQQPLVRAKLLVLAGVQAQSMGLDAIAALCRHKVLAQNPRHLVRKWPTIDAALGNESFRAHLKQLRRRYSREKVEHMMHSLGIEMGQERAAYFSDLEYAAALLDTRVDAIADILAGAPARHAAAGSPGEQPAPDDQRHTAGEATLGNRLLIWAPFVVGLAGLAVLALVSRTLGH